MKRTLLLIYTIVALILSSCKTTSLIQSNIEYKHDTTYITKHTRDSIVFRDTIMQKGDTIYDIKWRYIEKTQVDTIYKDNIIYKENEKVVTEVKKVIPKWIWWLIAVLGTISLYTIIRIAFKIYKNKLFNFR